MEISKSNKKNKNSGFTLVELVVVVVGLAALSSISIPSVIKYVKSNRLEEAKALMNSFAADCLINYRMSNNPTDFIKNYTPDQLNNSKLSSLQYQIDGDKSTCENVSIKPLNENENDLFPFDFRMYSDGRIVKTAKPSGNPSYLKSCKGWAGNNCGLTEAQETEFARLKELAAAKDDCNSKYYSWLSAKSSGEYSAWDSNKENCTRRIFAFEGMLVSSLEAVDEAQNQKYGEACLKWRKTTKDSLFTDEGAQTINPECGGVNYWFHSGNEFTTKAAWTSYDNQIKKQACEKNRIDALNQGQNGKYTIGPDGGPSPCGQVVWLCNGEEYTSKSDYETSSCSSVANDVQKGDEPDPDDPCDDTILITFCGFMDDPGLCKQVENCPSQ